VLEATVAKAGAGGGFGISAIEILQHGLRRPVEAVKIETVETGGLVVLAAVGAEPFGEVGDIAVAPHPRREALKIAEGFCRVLVSCLMLAEAVQAPGVRPVGLCRNAAKAPFRDEPLSDAGAFPVELVGACEASPMSTTRADPALATARLAS